MALVRQMAAMAVRVNCLADMFASSNLLPLPPWGNGEKSARLVIVCGGHIARLDGKDLNLARREFAALQVLATEAATDGGMVDRDRIASALEEATGHGDRLDEQVTKVVSTLRQKLGEPGTIKTIRVVGYRLSYDPGDIDVY